jgi:hypothetical protein
VQELQPVQAKHLSAAMEATGAAGSQSRHAQARVSHVLAVFL